MKAFAYKQAYSEYAHASRVLEIMKGKLFAHKFVWNESHIIWELPYTPILLL